MKDQIKIKLDLGKIKKRNPKSKSKDQMSVIQNVQKFFDWREKNIDIFKGYSFLLSEAQYKATYGNILKILSPKQMF